MQSFSFLGPLGLLVPAFLLVVSLCLNLGKLLANNAPLRHQILSGITATLSIFVLGLQVAFYANWVRPYLLLLFLTVLTLSVAVLRRKLYGPAHLRVNLQLRPYLHALPALLVVGSGLAIALAAAYFLPIWQWDSLGYHLPFVNFVLQGGGIAELPVDVPYLSTYPRNVELLFVALRATLPDDRLVDLGQIPLGIVAALAVFGIARQLGAARVPAAISAGIFLTLPAVYLQLPTNYIDIGVAAFYLLAAYFLMAEAHPRNLALAGLAIGLFLGTKPNAPPNALLLATLLIYRAYRGKQTLVGLLAIVAAGALGLEAYVVQLVKHGNPVWPAIVHLGPIELPGTISVDELLSSGAGSEKVHGSLPWRMVQSWTSLTARPTFDMRVGGFGPVFLILPAAFIWLVRNRRFYLSLIIFSTLVTPDPAVVRYILPFPGLLLAVLAAGASDMERKRSWARQSGMKWSAVLCASLVMAWNLNYATAGLTGEGPKLHAYPKMSWQQRRLAVGANGRPSQFVDAITRLRPGQIAVYDKSLWLPYLMWTDDLKNRVIRIPDNAEPEQVTHLLSADEVGVIFAGDDQIASQVIANQPEKYELLFKCPEPCTAYYRK